MVDREHLELQGLQVAIINETPVAEKTDNVEAFLADLAGDPFNFSVPQALLIAVLCTVQLPQLRAVDASETEETIDSVLGALGGV